MDSNIEVIYYILGLLPTIQEGLNHSQKQLSELRYEQALDLLEDTMIGIASIESALQPMMIDFEENNIDMKFKELKRAMSKIISLYENKKETSLEHQMQDTIFPAFKAWKEELKRVFSRLTKEYEKAFNGTQDAMFLIKVFKNGEFRYVRNNIAHQNKTGILLEQIINKTPQELLGKEMGDFVGRNYQKCVGGRKSITYEEELSLPGGERTWLTTLTPIMEGDSISHIVGSATDITERKKLEKELEKYANYDKLTGLPNRRLFFERLERMVIEKERGKSQFALLFIDLDGFKDINDRYGHVVGDEVLITVGNRLLQCIRKSDTVARMGGDEFTIIIRNIEDKKSVDNLVKKIHKALQEDMHIDNIECSVNSSIGVAIYPENGKDSETLLKNADSTMYEIKRNGKGGFNEVSV